MAAIQRTDVGQAFSSSASDAAKPKPHISLAWEKVLAADMPSRYGAELEVMRSALPTQIVRQSLDTDGVPNKGRAVALFRLDLPTQDEELLLAVWRIPQDDSVEISNAVGFVRRRKDGSDLRLILPRFSPRDLPDIEGGIASRIGDEETAWNGPVEADAGDDGLPDSESTPNDAPDTPHTPSFDESTGPELEATARSAKLNLDRNFRSFCAVFPDEPKRWWRSGKMLGAERKSDLLTYLRTSELRYELRRYSDAVISEAAVVEYRLPFYANYSLFDITFSIETNQDRKYYIVAHCDFARAPICALNGKANPLHEFNQRIDERNELLIDQGTAAAYLVFFCRFLVAELGSFWIIEQCGDIDWCSDDPKDPAQSALRQAVAQIVEPVVRLTSDDGGDAQDGVFRFGSFLTYGRTMSYCHFAIRRRTGEAQNSASLTDLPVVVEMIDDTQCSGELPIHPRTWSDQIVVEFAEAGPLARRFLELEKNARTSDDTGPFVRVTEQALEKEEHLRAHLDARGVFNFRYPDDHATEQRSVTTETFKLSFYKDYLLFRVVDRRGSYAKTYLAIVHQTDPAAPACYLGRSRSDVLNFNKALSDYGSTLDLTGDGAISYLSFFFSPYVSGREHSFAIAARAADILWTPRAVTDGLAKRLKIESTFESPRLLAPENGGKGDPGGRELVACAYDVRSFFCARFAIQSGGDIEVSHQSQIEKDPPCIPEIWEQRFYGVFRSN